MASLSAVDGPQCVTPTLYAQTQVDEWRHHLESEGYVVIRDMFDPDERVAMIRQFWSDFEQSCLLLSNASAHDDADAAAGTTHAAAAAMPPPVSNDRKSIKGKKATKKAARVKVQHVDYNKRAADRKQQSAKAPPEAYARFGELSERTRAPPSHHRPAPGHTALATLPLTQTDTTGRRGRQSTRVEGMRRTHPCTWHRSVELSRKRRSNPHTSIAFSSIAITKFQRLSTTFDDCRPRLPQR